MQKKNLDLEKRVTEQELELIELTAQTVSQDLQIDSLQNKLQSEKRHSSGLLQALCKERARRKNGLFKK